MENLNGNIPEAMDTPVTVKFAQDNSGGGAAQGGNAGGWGKGGAAKAGGWGGGGGAGKAGIPPFS